jgi:hypothetical protein
MNDILHPPLRGSHSEPKMGSERNFGLVFAALFAAISLAPLMHAGHVRVWPLPIAVLFLGAALLLPGSLARLNRAWFLLGILLGKVVTPLVMGVLFFVTVTPVGILMRLFGKDPLRLKRDPTAKSYWLDRSQSGRRAESLKDQF